MDLITHLNRASLVAIKEAVLELIQAQSGTKVATFTSSRQAFTDQLKKPPATSLDDDCDVPLEIFLKAGLQELLKVSTYISKSEVRLDPATKRYFLKPTCTISEDTIANKSKAGPGGSLYARITKLLKKLCILWELSDIDSYGAMRWDAFSNFCLRMGRSYFKASIKQTNLRFVCIYKGHSTIPNFQYHYIPSINVLISNDTDQPNLRVYRKFGKRILLIETFQMEEIFIATINPRTMAQRAIAATKSKQAAYIIQKNMKKEEWRPPERIKIVSMCVVDEHSCVYVSMSSSHIVRLAYKPPKHAREEQESDGDSDFSDGDDNDAPNMNRVKTFELTEFVATKQIQTGLMFSKKLDSLITWSGNSGNNAFRIWDGVEGFSDLDSLIASDGGIKTSKLVESFEVHIHSNVIVAVCEVFHEHIHYLASCSADNDVVLWSISFETHPVYGTRVITGVQKYKLDGHKRGVKNLAYAPQNQLLIGAGYDSIVYIWDPFSKDLIHQLRGHCGTIDGITVSYFPTEHLVSVDEHRIIKVWRLRKGFEGRCDEVCSIPLDVSREGEAAGATMNEGASKKKHCGVNPSAGRLVSEDRDSSNLKYAVHTDRFHIHGLLTAFERGRYFIIRSDELYCFMFKGSLSKDIRPIRNGLAIVPEARKIISLSQRMVYLFDLDSGNSYKQVHFLDNEITDAPKGMHTLQDHRNAERDAAVVAAKDKKNKQLALTSISSYAGNADSRASVSGSQKARPKSAVATRPRLTSSPPSKKNDSNAHSVSNNNDKFNPFSIIVPPSVKTLVPPSTFNESDSIKAITFDDSLRKMFLGTNSGVVHVYDISSFSLIKTLAMPRPNSATDDDEVNQQERGYIVSLSYVQRDGLLMAVFSSGAIGMFCGCISPAFPVKEAQKSFSENKRDVPQYMRLRPEPPGDISLVRSADYPLVNDNSVSLAAVSLVSGMVAVAVGETSSVIDASRIYFYDYCTLQMQFVVRLPPVSNFTLKCKDAAKVYPGVPMDELMPDPNDEVEPTLVYTTDMMFAADLPLLAVSDSVGRITLYRTCVDKETIQIPNPSGLDIYRILTWNPWESRMLSPPKHRSAMNNIFPAASIISMKLVFVPDPVSDLISSVDAIVSSITIASLAPENDRDKTKNTNSSNSNSNSNSSSGKSTYQPSLASSAVLPPKSFVAPTTRSSSPPRGSVDVSKSEISGLSSKHTKPNQINQQGAGAGAKSKGIDNVKTLTRHDFEAKLSGTINGRWKIIYTNDMGNIVVQDITALIMKEQGLIDYKCEEVVVSDTPSSNLQSRYKLTMYTNKFLTCDSYYSHLRHFTAFRYNTPKWHDKLEGLTQSPALYRRLEVLLEQPFGWNDIEPNSPGPNKQCKDDVTTSSFVALSNLNHGNVINIALHAESHSLASSFDDGIVQVRRLSDLHVIGQCEDSNAALKNIVKAEELPPWEVNIPGAKSKFDHHSLIDSAVRYINGTTLTSASEDSTAENNVYGTESSTSDAEIGVANDLFLLSVDSTITGPKSLVFGGTTDKARRVEKSQDGSEEEDDEEKEEEGGGGIDLKRITFEKKFAANTDYNDWKEVLLDAEEEAKRLMQKKMASKVKMTVKTLNQSKGDVMKNFAKAQKNTPLVGQADKSKVDKIQAKFNRIFQGLYNRVAQREVDKSDKVKENVGEERALRSLAKKSNGNERKLSTMLNSPPPSSPIASASPTRRIAISMSQSDAGDLRQAVLSHQAEVVAIESVTSGVLLPTEGVVRQGAVGPPTASSSAASFVDKMRSLQFQVPIPLPDSATSLYNRKQVAASPSLVKIDEFTNASSKHASTSSPGRNADGPFKPLQIPSYTVYTSQSSINIVNDSKTPTQLEQQQQPAKRPVTAPLSRDKPTIMTPFALAMTVNTAGDSFKLDSVPSSAAKSPYANMTPFSSSTPHFMLPTRPSSAALQPANSTASLKIDQNRLKQLSERVNTAVQAEAAEEVAGRTTKKLEVVSQYAQVVRHKDSDDVLVKNNTIKATNDSSRMKGDILGPYRNKEIIAIAGVMLELYTEELKRRDDATNKKIKPMHEYKALACEGLLLEDVRINLHVLVRNKTIIGAAISEKNTMLALGADNDMMQVGGALSKAAAANDSKPESPSGKNSRDFDKLDASKEGDEDLMLSGKIFNYCKRSFDNSISFQELLDTFFSHATVSVMQRIIRVIRLALMVEDMLSTAQVKEHEGFFMERKPQGAKVSLKNVASTLKAKAVGASNKTTFVLAHYPSISYGFEGWSVSRSKIARTQGILEVWCRLNDGGLHVSDFIYAIQALIPSDYLVNCRPVLQMATLMKDRLKIKSKMELTPDVFIAIVQRILKITIVD